MECQRLFVINRVGADSGEVNGCCPYGVVVAYEVFDIFSIPSNAQCSWTS